MTLVADGESGVPSRVGFFIREEVDQQGADAVREINNGRTIPNLAAFGQPQCLQFHRAGIGKFLQIFLRRNDCGAETPGARLNFPLSVSNSR
ncbi:hypothetical protein J8I26_03605 [Herbaspirillum sp. LeCh32-8]|uniref:hypothetical protein n=1 Tax=Herbaspirillum sp. LeCh32-8 TaxID=2821356 RepID=UPI001AE3D1EF|nr:hypothetical protein [Herbaspirillum sp. LeCh32-8]MBP0597173.1 hypothetical protein [Herbaspirillum sp. LeCh32-8]